LAEDTVCLEIGGADGPMTTILENLFDFVLTIDYSKTFLRRIEAKTKNTISLLSGYKSGNINWLSESLLSAMYPESVSTCAIDSL